MTNRIVDAAYNHGEVMQTAAHLADRIGSRLTNSPGMREAERWTQQQFKQWGLQDVCADGAADNAAGSSVVREAARILSRLGVQPRRTIRFVLWSGEVQGTLGSYAYAEKHLAKRPPVTNPELAAGGPGAASRVAFPVTPLPGFKDMTAYFNMDNGSGKIRSIHAEGNFAAVPVLRRWLAPLSSMGASAVVAKSTGSTDHVGMVRLGLPAFQFIQDPLNYNSTLHHSSADSLDHLRADDLRQASVIMASLLLAAANTDKPPRQRAALAARRQ